MSSISKPVAMRLAKALELGPSGQVFIVLVGPDFEGRLLPAGNVLDAALLQRTRSVSEALHDVDDAIEIRFGSEALPAEELRWLNQQREQLRRNQPLVLRLVVEQAARFARLAPDLWRWASVLDLTGELRDEGLGTPTPAARRFDERHLDELPYAPALDSNAVEAPAHDLANPLLEDI